MPQIPAVQQIERYVRQRRDTDTSLIGWGLYFFLLSWITLGVYPWVVYYQRLNRADLFRERKLNYYQAVLDFTKQYAEETGQRDAVYNQESDLENFVKDRFTNEHKPIKTGLSLILTAVTLGVWWFVAVYHLQRFWWEIQVTEQDFDEKLSQIWTKLDIVKYPVTFQPVGSLRRNYGLDLVLSFLTVGIWLVVWDYHLHTDPEKVFPEFHSGEDTVLNSARTAGD